MKENQNEKRIFTLAWEFPPITSGESIVCFRTLKYSRHYYDVCSGQAPTSKQLVGVKLPKNIRRYSLKGKYILWPIHAAIVFKKLDKLNNYKIMMSRVMPPNGHMAGLLIKLLKPKIKWAVYFSDPVWNSPFIKFSSLFSNNGDQRPNYLLMKLMGIPSKLAIHFGDILIFNNKRLARYVLGKKYETLKNKVMIVPYGHEGVSEHSIDSCTFDNNKLKIAHVGQIYGDRNLKILISAVEKLKVTYPELYRNLKIQQVGFICDEEQSRIKESSVSDCFEIISQVDYARSLNYMKLADCLLIIDPCFKKKEQNIYIPVKIYDYMSTGKPIVAIADKNSATADILYKTKSFFVSHNVEAVYKMLLKILKNGIENQNLIYYRQFHCKHGTKIMDDVFEKIIDQT